jgi:hypothetical protein
MFEDGVDEDEYLNRNFNFLDFIYYKNYKSNNYIKNRFTTHSMW